MTSSVTWRHPEHAQSIAHRRLYIGCPLEPSCYLASFPRHLAPKLWTEWPTDRQKDRQTRKVKIRVAKAERSWTNSSNIRDPLFSRICRGREIHEIKGTRKLRVLQYMNMGVWDHFSLLSQYSQYSIQYT